MMIDRSTPHVRAAADLLTEALPDALRLLSEFALSESKPMARQALSVLRRYLTSAQAINATLAPGADAAEAHLAALAWTEQREAELSPAAPQWH